MGNVAKIVIAALRCGVTITVDVVNPGVTWAAAIFRIAFTVFVVCEAPGFGIRRVVNNTDKLVIAAFFVGLTVTTIAVVFPCVLQGWAVNHSQKCKVFSAAFFCFVTWAICVALPIVVEGFEVAACCLAVTALSFAVVVIRP